MRAHQRVGIAPGGRVQRALVAFQSLPVVIDGPRSTALRSRSLRQPAHPRNPPDPRWKQLSSLLLEKGPLEVGPRGTRDLVFVRRLSQPPSRKSQAEAFSRQAEEQRHFDESVLVGGRCARVS